MAVAGLRPVRRCRDVTDRYGDHPAGIEDLNDLTEDHVQLVLAAEGVPAGDYAREILQNAGIYKAAMANVVSNEEDVKAVIT